MMEKIGMEADVTILNTKLTQTGHKMRDHSGTYRKGSAENVQMHNQTRKELTKCNAKWRSEHPKIAQYIFMIRICNTRTAMDGGAHHHGISMMRWRISSQ